MTTKVSIKGVVSSALDLREIHLTSLDPTVERNLSKDLLYVPYPASAADESGFGMDIGFDEDIFTVTCVLVNSIPTTYPGEDATLTPKEAMDYLTYLAKKGQQDYDVTFYYDGESYNVKVKQMNTAQQASWGGKRTVRMLLQVIAKPAA